MLNGIILITGGARSGKSAFAESLAQELGGRVTYIATAEARDPEMAQRILRHQASRPAAWKTIEAPLNLGAAIQSAAIEADVIIVDCITLYLNNLLMQETGVLGDSDNPAIDLQVEDKIQTELASVIHTAQTAPAFIIFVTNEVGLGLVPAYHLGRFYRDLAGRANREFAAVADTVFLLNMGIAIELKSLGISAKQGAAEIKSGIKRETYNDTAADK